MQLSCFLFMGVMMQVLTEVSFRIGYSVLMGVLGFKGKGRV